MKTKTHKSRAEITKMFYELDKDTFNERMLSANLGYFFNLARARGVDSDDLIMSLGYDAVVMATKTWNPKKSAYITWVTGYMKSEIRKHNYIPAKDRVTITMETKINDKLTIADTVSDNKDVADFSCLLDAIKKLPKKDCNFMSNLLVLSEVEVAKFYGISKQAVNQKKVRLFRKLKLILQEDGICSMSDVFSNTRRA